MLIFYRVNLNEQGQLSSLFWCDRSKRDDYKTNGDVVILETTYQTNRYNLICGLILGINKSPIPIFTNQDFSITKSIEKL